MTKEEHWSGCEETEILFLVRLPAKGPLASHLISLGYSSLL